MVYSSDMAFSVEKITDIIPPYDDMTKLFICVGGTSESGKSTFSLRMLEQQSANRIKYLKAASEYGIANLGVSDPVTILSEPDPVKRAVNETGTWNVIDKITDGKNRISVIESLKHPNFLASLAKTAINSSLFVIYFDADFDLRVEREAKKISLPIAEVREMTRLKDTQKASYGANEIKDFANIIVNNNGSEDDYLQWIEAFAAQVAQDYPTYVADVIEYL